MAKSVAFLALFAVVAMGFAVARAETNQDHHLGVRNLTRATLDDVRQGDWLLIIVAPWCGYSRNVVHMLPSFAYNWKNIQIAVIDGEEDPSIHTQFSLDRYPFICYVHDGVIYPFHGAPGYDDIEEFVKGGWKKSKPITGSKNPFGWQMSVLGATVHVLWIGYDFITRTAASLNLSASAAFSIVFALLTVITLTIIGCCIASHEDELVLDFPAPEEKKSKAKSEEKKPEKEQPEEKPQDKPEEVPTKSKKSKTEGSSLRKRKQRVE